MPEKRTYTYEAMFLLGQAQAADFSAAVAHVRQLIEKHGATIIALRKWDERRLAYEIKKQKRGLYILAYFKAPNDQLGHIERDCNLSEKVLRAMILRCDHLTEDEMRAFDGREGLETEAKLRASQAREKEAAEPVAVAASSEPSDPQGESEA